jgi:hypothetical protein
MRIRTALASAALAGALIAGVASPAAQAAESAPATASSGQAVQATWHDYDWYWLYDRCMFYGETNFGYYNIPYRCQDWGAGRWMLQYYV